MLNQFRQEQHQQQQQQDQHQPQQGVSGTSEGMAQRTPENNTAFLLSLPTTLRREVLADMEESQFDMLPPELAAEARQLRREHEERIARTVQNGVLTHSFTTRTDRKLPCSSCYVHLICCICTFFSSNLSRNVLIFSRLLLCHNPSQL